MRAVLRRSARADRSAGHRGPLYLAARMSDHMLRDIGLYSDGIGNAVRVRHRS